MAQLDQKAGSVKITAVLLDLDGVLLDHRAAAEEALRSWLGERATAGVVATWFQSMEARLAEWRAGSASWAEQRRNRLRDLLPLIGDPVGTDEQLDELFVSGYLAAYERSWRSFEDAAPALAALTAAGYRLGVLTNGSEAQQRQKLAAIGLLEAVGPVWTAERIGVAKPHPAAFRAACAGLGEPPGAVLYVGDQHEVDVLGARSAGLPAVLLDRDGTAPPGETAVISSLADLPSLFTDPAIWRDLTKRPDP